MKKLLLGLAAIASASQAMSDDTVFSTETVHTVVNYDQIINATELGCNVRQDFSAYTISVGEVASFQITTPLPQTVANHAELSTMDYGRVQAGNVDAGMCAAIANIINNGTDGPFFRNLTVSVSVKTVSYSWNPNALHEIVTMTLPGDILLQHTARIESTITK